MKWLWRKPKAAYALLAATVMLPLLLPGYILTLDMVFTPRLRMPDTVTSSYLFRAGLSLLNIIIPSQIIQKILLFGILFLSGWGMYLLSRAIQNKEHTVTTRVGAYAAGMLYMINPFTYSRFMAGQYSVLMGYALLPFFARAWLVFLAGPSRRRMLIVAAWIVFISIVSIHTLGAVGIVIVVGLCATAWRLRNNKSRLLAASKFCIVGLLLVVVANSYWLVPLALGRGSTAQSVQNFSTVDRQAFATEGGNIVGQLANIARLQGFWVEGQGLYALPQSRMPAWGLLVIMLWILIAIGAWQLWQTKRRFAVALFGVSSLTAALLATSAINNWLTGWLPLFAGFREPHKFVSLVALADAIFVGQGVAYLANKYRRKYDEVGLYGVAAISLVLIVAITPVMLWGFGGQLKPRQYPHDWFVINQQLRKDKNPQQTLFLPWHLYSKFSFSGRIVASPATDFFDVPVMVNNDPEFANVKPALPNDSTQKIGEILTQAAAHNDLAAQLAAHHIKYILLSNDNDAKDYQYLGNQKDLHLLQNTRSLKLYINEAILDK